MVDPQRRIGRSRSRKPSSLQPLLVAEKRGAQRACSNDSQVFSSTAHVIVRLEVSPRRAYQHRRIAFRICYIMPIPSAANDARVMINNAKKAKRRKVRFDKVLLGPLRPILFAGNSSKSPQFAAHVYHTPDFSRRPPILLASSWSNSIFSRNKRHHLALAPVTRYRDTPAPFTTTESEATVGAADTTTKSRRP